MGLVAESLEALCQRHSKFLRKGGLCVALVVTQTAKEKGLPLTPESLRTDEGGQVAGPRRVDLRHVGQGDHVVVLQIFQGQPPITRYLGLIRFMRSWSRDTRAFRRSKDGFSEAWLWRPQERLI